MVFVDLLMAEDHKSLCLGGWFRLIASISTFF